MADIKNTFLKGKMNKDLDDRIIPNGEYRDAINLSITKSEDDNVGALSSVSPNIMAEATSIYAALSNPSGLRTIGFYVNNETGFLYWFITSNNDEASSTGVKSSSSGKINAIVELSSIEGSVSSILVRGDFLNFSTQHRIKAINMIDDMLFWTDDYNQPRKINVVKAKAGATSRLVPTFYTKEEQISVAKYYPFTAPRLIKKLETYLAAGATIATGASQTIALLYTIDNTFAVDANTTLTFTTGDPAVNYKAPVNSVADTGSAYNVTIGQVQKYASGAWTNITSTVALSGNTNGTLLTFTSDASSMIQSSSTGAEKELMKEKFLKFAYRFKFVDNEFSLISPFTQTCFIPEFYKPASAGDSYLTTGGITEAEEKLALKHTDLEKMVNYVNELKLYIDLPYTEKTLYDELHVKEIEIVMSEANNPTLKVVESINVEDSTEKSNITTYTYKSTLPYKVLPENETIRVFDNVPLTAKTQEVVGNRIVYGNIILGHTPPTADFSVSTTERNSSDFDLDLEYPVQTLKQRRRYQVGLVVADKYGRQSSVIQPTGGGDTCFLDHQKTLGDNDGGSLVAATGSLTSSITTPVSSGATNGTYSGTVGSTSGFTTDGSGTGAVISVVVSSNQITTSTGSVSVTTAGTGYNIGDTITVASSVIGGSTNLVITLTDNDIGGGYDDGYGYCLNLEMLSQIQGNIYVPQGAAEVVSAITSAGSHLTAGLTNLPTTGGTGTGLTINVDAVNGSNGATAVSINNPGEGYTNGDSITYSNLVITINVVSNPNPLGWYSYKWVVKQKEQDYYNVYAPSLIKDYPVARERTWLTLHGDNINKVPRSLEPSSNPDIKISPSKAYLYPKIVNTYDDSGGSGNYVYSNSGNIDLFTDDPLKVITIGAQKDHDLGSDSEYTVNSNDYMVYAPLANFYEADKNHLIAELKNSYGVPDTEMKKSSASGTDAQKFDTDNRLVVFETKPFETALELYYETSTTGLVSELNNDFASGVTIADILMQNNAFPESLDTNAYTDIKFEAKNAAGTTLTNVTFTLDYITDANGNDLSVTGGPGRIGIAEESTDVWKLRILEPFYFNDGSINPIKLKVTATPSSGTALTSEEKEIYLTNVDVDLTVGTQTHPNSSVNAHTTVPSGSSTYRASPYTVTGPVAAETDIVKFWADNGSKKLADNTGLINIEYVIEKITLGDGTEFTSESGGTTWDSFEIIDNNKLRVAPNYTITGGVYDFLIKAIDTAASLNNDADTDTSTFRLIVDGGDIRKFRFVSRIVENGKDPSNNGTNNACELENDRWIGYMNNDSTTKVDTGVGSDIDDYWITTGNPQSMTYWYGGGALGDVNCNVECWMPNSYTNCPNQTTNINHESGMAMNVGWIHDNTYKTIAASAGSDCWGGSSAAFRSGMRVPLHPNSFEPEVNQFFDHFEYFRTITSTSGDWPNGSQIHRLYALKSENDSSATNFKIMLLDCWEKTTHEKDCDYPYQATKGVDFTMKFWVKADSTTIKALKDGSKRLSIKLIERNRSANGTTGGGEKSLYIFGNGSDNVETSGTATSLLSAYPSTIRDSNTQELALSAYRAGGDSDAGDAYNDTRLRIYEATPNSTNGSPSYGAGSHLEESGAGENGKAHIIEILRFNVGANNPNDNLDIDHANAGTDETLLTIIEKAAHYQNSSAGGGANSPSSYAAHSALVPNAHAQLRDSRGSANNEQGAGSSVQATGGTNYQGHDITLMKPNKIYEMIVELVEGITDWSP